MENDYQTPMKSHEGAGDGASTIAHGLTDNRGMTESKLEHDHQEDQQNQRNEEENRLDQIEKQIHEIGEQLRTLHLEITASSDVYSEQILSKERDRSELKKKIIDLDIEHKQIISKRVQEERRQKEEKTQQWKRELEEREQQRSHELQEREQRRKRQFEEREVKIRQEREERERRRKEELDKYEQDYREKLRNLSGSRNQGESQIKQRSGEGSQQEGSQQQQGQQSKGTGQASQTVQDELARSRRRLRIAEIEAELAVQRLERSRTSSLRTELETLRLSYLDPYFVYRPLALPSYYYPYSAYPVYNRWWYY